MEWGESSRAFGGRRELGAVLADRLGCGKPATGDKAERNRGVEMPPGDMTESVSTRNNGQAEREADAKKTSQALFAGAEHTADYGGDPEHPELCDLIGSRE